MSRFRQTRALLAVLVGISLVLITLDYRTGRGSPLDPVREFAGGVFGPIESGIAAGVRPVTRTVSGVTRGARASDRADRLDRENAALRQQLLLARAPGSADSLTELVGRAGGARLSIVPARVVALGAGMGFSWTATLDAGSRDGVRPDSGVISAAGLAGRVKSVTPSTCTVLLAVDPAAKVGVRIAGSGQIGMLTGGGAAPLTLDMLAANSGIRAGQTLTTLGSPNARPYPAGVPVGRITRVLAPSGVTARALVEPATRFTALDLVGIVVGAPRVRPREALTADGSGKPEPVVSEPPSASDRP